MAQALVAIEDHRRYLESSRKETGVTTRAWEPIAEYADLDDGENWQAGIWQDAIADYDNGAQAGPRAVVAAAFAMAAREYGAGPVDRQTEELAMPPDDPGPIQEAVQELSEQEQRQVWLRVLEHTHAEIAETLGISHDAARKRWQRIRAKLAPKVETAA